MNKRTEHFIVVSGVTAVFFTEALIHYNMALPKPKIFLSNGKTLLCLKENH